MISLKGLFIALTLIVCWFTSLVFLLHSDLLIQYQLLIPLFVLLQTFLYTGLFITAHDAMHGSIYTKNRRLNNLIGSFAVFLYALFSFNGLKQKHYLHHRFPGRKKDPDFHNGQDTGFFAWYFHFMRQYIHLSQIIGMAVLFNLLLHVLGVPLWRLLLFWVLPSFLSTIQLFYFGTFLTHKQPKNGFTNQHHAKSNDYPVWLSFLTCFHFGYHLEHHQFPRTPWYALPAKYFCKTSSN